MILLSGETWALIIGHKETTFQFFRGEIYSPVYGELLIPEIICISQSFYSTRTPV
jgi:hypothetical protein